MSSYQHIADDGGRELGQFAPLAKTPGLVHAVTTASWGLFDRDTEASAEAYRGLAGHLGLADAAWAQQVHGPEVRRVTEPGSAGECDAMHTDRPGLGLLARSADCPLVLLADRDARTVGIAHASWRCTVAGIAGQLVRAMTHVYGLDPDELIACICPSAGPDRYEVGPEVYQAMLDAHGPDAKHHFLPARQDGKRFFDLWSANSAQLMAAGVDFLGLYVAHVCTIDDERYPSYRRQGPDAQRFGAMIGLSATSSQ